ncbi:PAS domain-containing sensor histidine kinase [Caenimonas sp. SL110]|uniref:PAS domain-containing hybrid sensor histidine kinase/response regulator n=1 Tax=Caenimonas sp. SL110 TaxID=1450524 RepID=UPI00065318DE|nr:PAS domain-containing sensor histidine kinase [Caenimonas sp. SL110]
MSPDRTPVIPDTPVEHRFQQLIEAVVDYGIFILSPGGIITSWNSGAEKLKGYTRAEILGQHFSVFYEPEAVARGWPQYELQQAIALGRFEDEGWRLRKDGSRFWANVIITAVKDDSGQLSGFTKITRDLTERRSHEEALRLSEERFRLLVQDVRDYGIFMLDPDGIVRGWNAGAQAMKGYAAHEIIGRHFSTFYTPDDQRSGKPARELEIATDVGRVEDEGWRVRKDGTVFWANVIITALRNKQGELVGFGKVTRDMTERRKLQDLEMSSRRMNEFLAMLAHELRNPLAPIRNSVSVMQLQPIENPALQKCRDIIDRQLTHMTRLVDDLLDIGRLTTGKIKLRLEPTSLADVVSRSVETVRPLLEARCHTITIEVPPEPVYLSADSTRLAQVLQNLLVNSARYTAEGGEIGIKVEVDGGFATTSVTDNGRGIASGELDAIFELFRQGDNGKLPDESGLGIGLTLARSLVELHGGVLDARSEGPGKGSTFEFRLPAVMPEDRGPRTVAAKDTSPGRRVLVVDDNRDAADSSSDMLRLLGHRVETAYDGEQALVLAARFTPEVVLLDLSMPGIDGFETLRALRTLPGMVSSCVIAMTGYGSQDDTRRTHDAGFDGHLTKPVALADLVTLIERG